MINLNKIKLAVLWLGYVGLPLAVEFGKKREVFGFDINVKRIKDLKEGHDKTLVLTEDELNDAKYLNLTSKSEDLTECNFYIVTVPTPIDKDNKPDLNPLYEASKLVGSILKKNNIVVYESTVFPGATEEECVPILEEKSNLKFNEDFFVGYSPERINPGDKEHTLAKVVKVTSGSTNESAILIDQLYREIIQAGTHLAPSIKVAEAAKVIENTQRDLNIALINELAIIFNKMSLDTTDVLKAAQTKWNFLPFEPGLVGGHCIGVDPYYLTYKSESLGYVPQVILSGRKLNDRMGTYIAEEFIKEIIRRDLDKKANPKILILGLTFKENCSDLRNSKTVDIYNHLKGKGYQIDVYEPWASSKETESLYGFVDYPENNYYEGVILTVAHKIFKDMGIKEIRSFGRVEHVLYDLKSIFGIKDSDLRL